MTLQVGTATHSASSEYLLLLLIVVVVRDGMNSVDRGCASVRMVSMCELHNCKGGLPSTCLSKPERGDSEWWQCLFGLVSASVGTASGGWSPVHSTRSCLAAGHIVW